MVSRGLEEPSYGIFASKLIPTPIGYKGKWNIDNQHIGGSFVERLSKGDWAAIIQRGEHGFIYSGDGGGVLTFSGELIAVSNID